MKDDIVTFGNILASSGSKTMVLYGSVCYQMLNIIMIVVSKMTSNCAGTVQMREES